MYAATFGLDYWNAALEYWRNPEKKSWILVNPAAIGDTWCALALARGFRDTHGGPITVVMRESQRPIAEMFADSIDQIICWEDVRLQRFAIRLMGSGYFDIDQPIIAHPAWHGAGRNIFPLMERLRYPGKGGLNFLDQWRLTLRLPWSTPMQQPTIPSSWRDEAALYGDSIGVEPGQSVILFPDNNTNPPVPEPIWQEIANALARQGWRVFTNMAGNRFGRRLDAFTGTTPIEITVRSAVPLVERAGRYVSMANGMQVMLLGSCRTAQHTYLIHDAPPGHKWGGLGYPVSDMLMQSSYCAGIADGPFNEYIVNERTFSRELADAIAANSPEHIARFFIET
jgi:hypothetical protein